MKSFSKFGFILGVFGLALLCLAPVFGMPEFYVRILDFVAINIMVISGLVVLYGYCDQISLATGAFYGIGAYTVGILTSRFDFPLILALVCAGLFAGLMGFLVGLPAIRLKSHYLAMATLAFSELMIWLFVETPKLTGGVDGLALTDAARRFWPLPADISIHVLIVVTMFVVLFITYNLTTFIPGKACSAVGQHDVGARASGVAVEQIKVRAYIYSSVTAAVAGGLYAALVGFISPQVFGPALSITFLAMAIIGGRESLLGPVLATVAITMIQYINVLIPGLSPTMREFVSTAQIDLYALAIIGFTLFAPTGIKGWLARKNRGAN